MEGKGVEFIVFLVHCFLLFVWGLHPPCAASFDVTYITLGNTDYGRSCSLPRVLTLRCKGPVNPSNTCYAVRPVIGKDRCLKLTPVWKVIAARFEADMESIVECQEDGLAS